jgi:signal transduction histidine kinase
MNRRDLAADLGCVLLAVVTGLVLLVTRLGGPTGPGPGLAVDLALGALSCGSLWFRRRWPAGVALLTAVTGIFSLSSGGAAFVSVGNAGLRCRAGLAAALTVLHQAAMIGYLLIWVPHYPFWAVWLVSMSEYAAVLVFGLYLRARRQLVASLHGRLAAAVAAQQAFADQARLAERNRIAREMHDVLAHRVSLMALHAGALEIAPDQPPDAVRETAGLIRSTARQTLTELREVIGVLGDQETEAPRTPQPTLDSIQGLVGEYRRAGLDVALTMEVAGPAQAPGALGRDAYRIVREGLANVSKHARGSAATVSVSGRAGDGLRVTVRNKLPPAFQAATLPGAGLGLIGLSERVALAGGTLTHGPERSGDFALSAALRWEAAESC